MDGLIFKAFVKSKKLNQVKLAKAMGMSKQNLYQLFKSGEFEKKTVESIESHFKTKWEKVKAQVNIDLPQELKAAKTPNGRTTGKPISLNQIFEYTQTNKALLLTVVETLAGIQEKADKRKPGEVLAEMHNKVTRHLQTLRKGGI